MKFLIHLTALLFPICSWAQVSLSYYLDKAKENNPATIEQANLTAVSKLEMQRIKKETMGTKVFATADYLMAPYFNNKKFIDTNPETNAIGYDVGITNGGLYSALLIINQPIFAHKTFEAYQTSQEIAQSKYSYTTDLLNRQLALLVTQQYLEVYRDQSLIEANNALLKVINDQVNIINQLATTGIAKQSDVLLVNVEKKNQQSVIQLLVNKKLSDIATLNTTCGLQDSSMISVERPQMAPIEINETTHSFLKLYQLDSLSVEANKEVYATRYRPQVQLYGNTGLNAVAIDNIQNKLGFSVGIGLSLPIYDGHQKDINEQKARLLKSSIEAYKERKSLDIQNNIQKYSTIIRALQDNMQILEDQQHDYEELMQQYKVEIQSGQLSIINYITSLRYYRTLRIKLINTQIDQMQAESNLKYWNW